ncbi:MAG: hypothetical protein HXY27_04945 [Hydrogenophilaceae bacterium]|nr:hypothetical protein [Hydrogenophilaceae bacterium]
MNNEILLPRSLAAWGTPAFENEFKTETAQLDASQLPLQQGLSLCSHVADSPISVRILGISETPDCLLVKAGILYAGIVAGCSCADDPTPISEQTEYCEVMFEINKLTSKASVSLMED